MKLHLFNTVYTLSANSWNCFLEHYCGCTFVYGFFNAALLSDVLGTAKVYMKVKDLLNEADKTERAN